MIYKTITRYLQHFELVKVLVIPIMLYLISGQEEPAAGQHNPEEEGGEGGEEYSHPNPHILQRY